MGHYQSFNGVGGGGHNSRDELDKIKLPKDMTGLTLLDIGCAEGFYCFEAVSYGCAQVVGIDIKPERIAEARNICNKKNCTNVLFLEMNLYDIKNFDKFDIVLFLSVSHHLKDLFGALQIIYDVTKKLLIAEIEVSGSNDIRKDERGFQYPPKEWVITTLKLVGWENILEIGSCKNENRIVFHAIK